MQIVETQSSQQQRKIEDFFFYFWVSEWG
jgi:hypothetical protein